MRLFFDTEFIEDGKTIELISIGIVREDGAEYYAENTECDLSRADDWVHLNVVPGMRGAPYLKTLAQIKTEIMEFAGEHPEWWAYYAAYDWVVMCRLFGRMIDLPMHWPKFCRDLQQLIDFSDVEKRMLPRQTGREHDALSDARWVRSSFNFIMASDWKRRAS